MTEHSTKLCDLFTEAFEIESVDIAMINLLVELIGFM